MKIRTWKLEEYLVGVVIVTAVFTITLMCWAIYDEVMSEKFYLRKDSWHCTVSRREYRGKIIIDVCDTWVRK